MAEPLYNGPQTTPPSTFPRRASCDSASAIPRGLRSLSRWALNRVRLALRPPRLRVGASGKGGLGAAALGADAGSSFASADFKRARRGDSGCVKAEPISAYAGCADQCAVTRAAAALGV